jgi:hypothetical protein
MHAFAIELLLFAVNSCGHVNALCRLTEAARKAEVERQQAAVRAAEYERTAREEAEKLRARREAAKKVNFPSAL